MISQGCALALSPCAGYWRLLHARPEEGKGVHAGQLLVQFGVPWQTLENCAI